jgi:hypothetical protein
MHKVDQVILDLLVPQAADLVLTDMADQAAADMQEPTVVVGQ